MPGHHIKHVRFAYKNSFYSPPVTPAMPPLTFSPSTDTSSLGVITPPSAFYPVPLPNPSKLLHTRFPHPHPYLDMYGINWNMMDHPSTMSRNYHAISGCTWKESATSPPLAFMLITIANFPWKFNVYASSRNYVTFEDVVETIYRSLRKNITEAEFKIASVTDRRRATRAYEQRYRLQHSTKLYEEEKRGGMKRVDFLMERTHFAGLSNVSRRPDEWHLNIT